MDIRLQDYTPREQIHEGTSTTLYRAVRNSDGAHVIIKLPSADHAGPREIARLMHEHGILRDLDVPGVVKTYGLETFDRGSALILEDLGGESLADVLSRRKLGLKAFLTLASSLADVLDKLHQRHILHKDIKPENIFVTAEGGACLVDFCLAVRLSQETQRAVRPDALEGTLAYMSPEQTGRMNRVVDSRSDLYSAGVTFYELLTGELPFTSPDPMELIHSHIARRATPPAERVPGLPAQVSDIVMKLLCKAAEDRYQTARGLKADLDECLRQWNESGTIAPFLLGRYDVSGELHIPQKLYGRAAELAELEAAFDRVHQGATELLLVAGYSGVGKSALVQEIHKPIAARGGYFISGKFDQFNRSIPYAPIAHAFRDLFRQILTEPEEALQTWRAELLGALGGNAQLLIDIIPEVELVIGPQPPVQALGASESQNRFAVVFQSFLQVFCAPEHPLVIFLDDLQWADLASLKLLQLSLTRTDVRHLLVIGAYRDNEVDAAHPLVTTLNELRRAGTSVRTLTLGPLELQHVTQMLATMLDRSPTEVEPLARLVREKTQGNPFFLNQLVKALHKERLLTFDASSGSWRWDLEGTREVAATSNVVEFMVGKIKRLGERTQRALRLAACIGHRFDLNTLAVIHERSQAEVAESLWQALEEGLVLPLHSDYRLVHGPSSQSAGAGRPAPNIPVSYRFLHDRVQQAAYSLIDGAHKREVHLKIGRRMLAQASREALDEQIFDIVGHLNRGASLITEGAERLALARMNLAAATKAKAATAYESAVEYVAAGIALLSDADWEANYDLAFELHLDRAHCELLAGRAGPAEAMLDDLLPRARSKPHRAQVLSQRIVLTSTQGRYKDSLNAAREAFLLYGVDLPTTEEGWKQAFETELSEVRAKLSGRRASDLLNAPDMTDPEMLAIIELWGLIFPTAYFLSPTLLGLVALKEVNISLDHGSSAVSSYGYMTYAMLLAKAFGEYEEAYEYGRLALDLNRKFNRADLVCKLNELFSVFVMFYRRPLRETLEHLNLAYQAGLSAGDFPYLSYTTAMTVTHKIALGEELGDFSAEVDRYLALMQRTNEAFSTATHKAAKRAILFLADASRSRGELRDESPEEKAFCGAIGASGLEMAVSFYYTCKAQILFLYEDYAGALSAARRAEELSWNSMTAHFTTDQPFYICLSLLALYPAATPAEREQYDAEITRHQARMARWTEGSPATFRHKLLLVEAERARVRGSTEAVRLYEQAIDAARINKFVPVEALANELCAKFYLGLGSAPIASMYMNAAHAGYGRWGAAAKVAQIEEAYSGLLLRAAAPVTRESSRSSSTSQSMATQLFDITAAVRAAQAIAGEIVLPRVVDRLMRIVLMNSGAERGALILHRNDHLVLEATLSVNPERVEVGINGPLEDRADLPQTLLHYVARTREHIVLADAMSDARFASDPAITALQPKSVLCMPLLHQGRLTGMIYLEHRAVRDVFTAAHVELLGLLASQTAIAIENASLLANVEAVTAEVRHTNERLEGEVARRTTELREANQGLSAANERLQVELAERARAEQERAALQEQIIATQESRMAEMSTPFLPITDQIMVMPLIGTLDSRRATQILEVALRGAQSRRAKMVILDITGVKQADAQVADTIIRTASALRLLGSKAILTGLRPEVAQTLVNLGIDLGMLTTHGTLQSAVRYALAEVAPLRRG
ncbi:MAG TPA: AAA family ATPase [Polyangiaceae bacterium]|nr:AAA family ATPase [Polyangiaceae bacterium]